jgi:hypothetical protein
MRGIVSVTEVITVPTVRNVSATVRLTLRTCVCVMYLRALNVFICKKFWNNF